MGEAAMGLGAYQNLVRYPHGGQTKTHVMFVDKHIALVPHTVAWLHDGPGMPGSEHIGWPLGAYGTPIQGY